MTNIILIGFMSCGKSSVGRYLAAESGMELVDLDQVIVEKAGMSIPDIFATVGEKAFRDLESYVTSLMRNYDNTIFATGGGVVLRENNRAILRRSGLVVWLKTTPENVLKYTKTDTNRPLLQDKKSLDSINSMMKLREPIYQSCAHYSINAWENNLGQIASKVWGHYGDYQERRQARSISFSS
ncbi:MAG: shikimate kinase [Lentisphaeraceae bacterium]|nr:shikimate kinase [Lentisphaeraceae bacterium]